MILFLPIILCIFPQLTITTAFAICGSSSVTKCTKITNCEGTLKYIQELHSSNSILHYQYMIGYMRSITCGFDGKVPKVCCSLLSPYPRIVKRMALAEKDTDVDVDSRSSVGANYLFRGSTGIVFPDEPIFAESDSTAKPDLDLTNKADSDSTSKTDSDSTTKAESDATTIADSDSTTKVDSNTTTIADSDSTTKVDSDTTTVADSDLTTETDSSSTTETNSESSPGSDSDEDLSTLPTVCGNFIWSKNLNSDDHPTDLDEFPWLVLLEYNTTTGTRIGCGGVLISNRYVLTAAHCVSPSLNLTSVRLGEHDLNMDPDCSYEGSDYSTRYCTDKSLVVTIEKLIPHENYSFVEDANESHSKPYDIALIRLSQGVISDYIKPICLPGETSVMKGKFLSAGWGADPNNAYLRFSVKRMFRLTGVEDEVCHEKYDKQLQDDMLCAQSKSLNTACIGDSGGPLISIDVESRMTVEGLFSPVNNEFCLISGVPGTYTNVRKYTDWIKANL